jgi:D-glycero-D-manno-heptose 1,7-bisphosphate phosphatase
MNKAVFLDRDGVINTEIGDHVYTLNKFEIISGVKEAIQRLKEADFKLIIVTNQSGIVQSKYTRDEMNACHDFMQHKLDSKIDHIYYSPYHERFTRSLTRKPDSLMFEKGIAKYRIDPIQSWMIGDKERDLIPAKKFNMQTIMVGGVSSSFADYMAKDLLEATNRYILS